LEINPQELNYIFVVVCDQQDRTV
ncbi:MAG: hypothetical protein JWO97_1194, partial [Acidobacteria bacterium]|nr:hypothetical protein [Acidobacteriota bacterium]